MAQLWISLIIIFGAGAVVFIDILTKKRWKNADAALSLPEKLERKPVLRLWARIYKEGFMPAVLKVIAIVLFFIMFWRVGFNDVFDSLTDVNALGLVRGEIVWLAVLRCLSYAAVAIAIVAPFYRLKTLKNLSAFFLPIVCVLNIIFFNNVMLINGGADFTAEPFRIVQFILEVGLVGVIGFYSLFDIIRENKWQKPQISIPLTLVVLFGIILATLPVGAPQIFFGVSTTIGNSSSLPDDFKIGHRIWLYVMAVVLIATYFIFRKTDSKTKWAALTLMSLGALVCYASNNTEWVGFGLRSLPWHLCNAGNYFIFLVCVFRWKPLYYFNLFANVVGAAGAIIMPDISATTTLFNTGAMDLFFTHIILMVVPILVIMWGEMPRPTMKTFSWGAVVFTFYFLAVIFINAYFNSAVVVDPNVFPVETLDKAGNIITRGPITDYFFLTGDVISGMFGVREIQVEKIISFTIDGKIFQVSWLYDILLYFGFLGFALAVWFMYYWAFKAIDHYKKLDELKVSDALGLREFKKRMGGRPLFMPVNEKGVNMLRICHFSKVYGFNKHRTVDDFSLEVSSGEVFGFLGHNGAGKSTVIKSIVGIQSISEGNIEVCGFDITSQPIQAKSNIGYVSDNHASYETLTGREYVNYVADLYKVDKADRDARIAKYLEIFELAYAFDQQIKSYSHGMKQKLSVIAALVHNPKVWILDEPLTGLDPSSAYQIKECMRAHADAGNIVLFSSHIIEVVERICDRICIIKKGKMQGVFDLRELRERGVDLEELYLAYHENDEEKQKELIKKLGHEPYIPSINASVNKNNDTITNRKSQNRLQKFFNKFKRPNEKFELGAVVAGKENVKKIDEIKQNLIPLKELTKNEYQKVLMRQKRGTMKKFVINDEVYFDKVEYDAFGKRGKDAKSN
ncbi:MAG: YwaF family protein [Christensenellaceae bacterium]|jgi:ABC-2 type transport system ATP-binding protein|nr:YwaF family protein [Christensenellaceae bacterium]